MNDDDMTTVEVAIRARVEVPASGEVLLAAYGTADPTAAAVACVHRNENRLGQYIDIESIAADVDEKPWHAAGARTVRCWDRFVAARDPLGQAEALVELSNAVSDLRSWLPGYDAEYGPLP